MATNHNSHESQPAAAKPAFDGDIAKLCEVPRLSPLADFPFATRPVTEHIQSIGHGWYLLIGDRPEVVDGVPKETIRACMIIWAANVCSAILVSCCEDPFEADGREDNLLPPIEDFLPKAKGWKYGEILKSGRGKLMESASYGNTGEFEFKKFWAKSAYIYFRSRTRKLSELPIAISLIRPPK